MALRDLPSGTVTFLFTDIEGSTRLLAELGPEHYAGALAEHRRLIRSAMASHGGVEVDTQGDAFFVAFPDAGAAVRAAHAAQQALAAGPLRVRMGLHTGQPHLTDEGYVGHDIHLGARIAAAGHGRQVLLSGATRDAIGDQIPVVDLGEHRLKDFPQPVWIYQLGDEGFPPLKTISNTNLPRPASAFVGREQEVADITELLRDGARLLTLTGPGGTGKTRLSLEAASLLVGDFRNGTYWVDLAPIVDPELVVPTIAGTVGASGELADHISERQMLLVLDNLEQVVDAAPLVGSVVTACPNLRVLATSRERLRVHDEVEYKVLPLPLADAIELFTTRANVPADDVIGRLCERLDRLPLAIELAAARSSVMSPGEILERLSRRLDLLKGGRDADARQQTLRATIEWSYDLLNEDERRLFARLAAFSGGWTLEAAEAVADADIDILQSLVEKSLVRHEDQRFAMLETIREFATEKLEVSDRANRAKRRHAAYFIDVLKNAAPHVRAESAEWLDRLEFELDNLRSAFDFLESSGDDESLAALMAAGWEIWVVRGPFAEGRQRVEKALARETGATDVRAQLLIGAADYAIDAGDIARARTAAQEALELYRRFGIQWGEAYALLELGLSFSIDEDFEPALALFRNSADLFDSIGDVHWSLQSLRRVAWAYESLGDKPRAAELWRECLRRARETGDEFGEARALSVLATYEIEEGRVTLDAIEMLKSAHEIHRLRRDTPDRYFDAIILCRLALALAKTGHHELATALVARFETRVLEVEGPSERWVKRMNDETRVLVDKRLGASAIAAAEEMGRALTVDDAVAKAVRTLRDSVEG